MPALRYVNDLGQERWQPVIYDGKRSYDTGWWHPKVNEKSGLPQKPSRSKPTLYRTYRQALRVARRREAEIQLELRARFREG